MSIASAIVLYAVLWFLVLFVALPIGLRTQGDEGRIVPGTQASAPANFQLRRKIIIVTIISAGLWAIVYTVIISGWISVRDFDWRDVMG